MPENQCPRCGTPVDGGLNYCPKCGQRLFAGEATPVPEPPAPPCNVAPQYIVNGEGGSRGAFNVVLLAIVAVLLLIIAGLVAFFLFSGSASEGATHYGTVKPDTVVQQVIVKEQVVTPKQPKRKPVYFRDRHYNLEGSIDKGSKWAEVSFEFDIVDGKVSSGVYNNYKANDGAIYVNMRRKGNTISGDGYDNIGVYFKFHFTARGNGTYTGKLYFRGTDAMNLTLHD